MAYGAFNQNGWIGDWIVLVLLVSSGYPLDCYNYLSTCGAKNLSIGLKDFGLEKSLGIGFDKNWSCH